MTNPFDIALASLDPNLKTMSMQQLGITRDMLDEGITVEEYLKRTGQSDLLSAYTLSRYAKSSVVPPIGSVVSPVISQFDSPVVFQTKFNPMNALRQEGVPGSKDAHIRAAYEEFQKALGASLSLKPGMRHDASIASVNQLDPLAKIEESIINHPVTDLLLQSTLGNVGNVFAGLYTASKNKRFVEQTYREIQNSYAAYCRPDLKIAAEYRAKNTAHGGQKKSPLAPLTRAEEAAFENLWKTMETHGGNALFIQKLREDMEGIGGLSALGNTAINTVLKMMEADDGVPSLEDVKLAFKKLNIAGGGVLLLTALFPPAFLASVAGAVVANAMLLKVTKGIGDWQENYQNKQKRAEFLYDIGEFAGQQIASNPGAFSDQELQLRLQAQVEKSACDISKGPAHYVAEDIRTLVRYNNSSAYWLGERLGAEDENRDYLRINSAALKKFIGDARIIEDKNLLIQAAGKSLINR